MSRQDPADVERRLEAGEWLRIGDLMILFDASRAAVDRWLRQGVRLPGKKGLVIRYRFDPSGERRCMPEDVQAVLAESRKLYSVNDPPPDDAVASE